MPTNISEVSTFTANIAVPLGGDLRNAASVTTGFQALANRTKWLSDHTIDKGGTYTLVAPLIMNAQPITIGGGLTVGGTVNGGGNMVAAGSMTAGADMSVGNDLQVAGASAFLGAAVFSVGVQVNGVLGLAAGALVAGGVTTDSLAASANISGNTASFSGVLSFTGAGHARPRTVAGSLVDATYGIADADVVFVHDNLLAANRVYTLSSAGAVTGDVMTFINLDNTYTISVLGIPIGGPTEPARMSFIFLTAAWFQLWSNA